MNFLLVENNSRRIASLKFREVIWLVDRARAMGVWWADGGRTEVSQLIKEFVDFQK